MYLQDEKAQKWPDPPFYSICDPFTTSPGIKIITREFKALNVFLLNSPHHQCSVCLLREISMLLPFKCNHYIGLFNLIIFLQFCIPFPPHIMLLFYHVEILLDEFPKTYLIIFQMFDFFCFKFMKYRPFCINPCLHLELQVTIGQCGDSGFRTLCSWKSMCNFWL